MIWFSPWRPSPLPTLLGRSPLLALRVSSTPCLLVSSSTRGIVDLSKRVIVISIVAQKGGAGKTTLSVGLACAATAVGLSAVVVDLDPQATAASWGDRRHADAPVVLSVQPSRLPRILEAASAQNVDLAVIDSAPRAEQSAIAAVKAADLVLLPTRPSVYDLETVLTTVELVRAVRPDVPLRCVLNAVPARGPREAQARALLSDLGVPLFDRVLGHRAAVDYAAVAGLTPQEYEPAGKAAAEMIALYESVCRIVDLSPTQGVD